MIRTAAVVKGIINDGSPETAWAISDTIPCTFVGLHDDGCIMIVNGINEVIARKGDAVLWDEKLKRVDIIPPRILAEDYMPLKEFLDKKIDIK
jgi:hypothetical protein